VSAREIAQKKVLLAFPLIVSKINLKPPKLINFLFKNNNKNERIHTLKELSEHMLSVLVYLELKNRCLDFQMPMFCQFTYLTSTVRYFFF